MNMWLSNIYYHITDVMLTAETKMDFYNTNGGEGDGSILPFLGFMCSVFGLVLLAMGITRVVSAKRKFNIFFDQRDQSETPDENSYKKEVLWGRVMAIAGAIFMVASFILL